MNRNHLNNHVSGASHAQATAPAGAILQTAIAAATLAACLLMPRPGAALLLVPLAGKPPADPQLLAQSGLTLLGQGRIPGSLVVHARGSIPVWPLLRHGMIPLTAPESLCGQTLSKEVR